jgi:transposase
MIVERILHGQSKLADTLLWHTSTLAEELAVGDATAEELYAAMDWLLQRQSRIEKKLAAKHLHEGANVFYDVSSSYYEGRTCPLAHFGHNRDEKQGREIIVYGLMTDAAGRPVSVQVYPGNTGDSTTVPDQVAKLRTDFGLQRIVLVGDRGMLTNSQLDTIRQLPGVGWLSALRSAEIRQLVESGALQLSLFDQRNLAEIQSPDYPGERLIACFNPLLESERKRKREDLLLATEQRLTAIRKEVRRRTKTPLSAAKIGAKVGAVLNRWKMAKHFVLTIEEGRFEWERNQPGIEAEAAIDGIYIIRTGEAAATLSSEDAVRQYKNLGRVEEVFRTMKSTDILIRPIRHRLEDRVRAHVFLCLLAYYVIWHMKQLLAPLLYQDETVATARQIRDPVAKAEPTPHAKRKKALRTDSDGTPLRGFAMMLETLQTRCRNRCVTHTPKGDIRTIQHTQPDDIQKRAFDLLGLRLV